MEVRREVEERSKAHVEVRRQRWGEDEVSAFRRGVGGATRLKDENESLPKSTRLGQIPKQI